MPWIYPAPTPAPQTGLGMFSENFKPYIDLLSQALMKQYLEGSFQQVPQQTVAPTGNLQNLQLPNGKVFSGTPEAAQRLIPDYIHNLQSQVNQGTLPIAQLPSGFTATPTGRSRSVLMPSLDREEQQAKIGKLKSETEFLTQASKGEVKTVGVLNGEIVPSETPGAQVYELKTGRQGQTLGKDLSPDKMHGRTEQQSKDLLQSVSNARAFIKQKGVDANINAIMLKFSQKFPMTFDEYQAIRKDLENSLFE